MSGPFQFRLAMLFALTAAVAVVVKILSYAAMRDILAAILGVALVFYYLHRLDPRHWD